MHSKATRLIGLVWVCLSVRLCLEFMVYVVFVCARVVCLGGGGWNVCAHVRTVRACVWQYNRDKAAAANPGIGGKEVLAVLEQMWTGLAEVRGMRTRGLSGGVIEKMSLRTRCERNQSALPRHCRYLLLRPVRSQEKRDKFEKRARDANTAAATAAAADGDADGRNHDYCDACGTGGDLVRAGCSTHISLPNSPRPRHSISCVYIDRRARVQHLRV